MIQPAEVNNSLAEISTTDESSCIHTPHSGQQVLLYTIKPVLHVTLVAFRGDPVVQDEPTASKGHIVRNIITLYIPSDGK